MEYEEEEGDGEVGGSGRWEEEAEEEEGEEDSLHTVSLQLYPEHITYPCLFVDMKY